MKWVRWAWFGIALTAVVALILGGIRFAGRQYRSVQEGSINKLLASSRAHEVEGRLDLALLDLDAAIDLARRAGALPRFPLEEHQTHRADLARRDAEGSFAALMRASPGSYSLGDWLNLIARSRKDPDLSSLKPEIESKFRDSLRRQAATELETARRECDAGRAVASLRACDRVAILLPHMTPDAGSSVRREVEDLVTRLVQTNGVALETPRGDFVLGSHETYRAHLLPVLIKALEAKDYLPYRESSPWKSAWQKAKYVMRLKVSERLEGSYLSSQNRLTRIEARLMLTLASSGKVVWQTIPTARTSMPVPGLPAYLATKIAVKPDRDAECERILYEDARGQIDNKFAQALSQMYACCP